MSLLLTWLTGLSLLGLLFLSFWHFIKTRQVSRFVVHLLLLVLVFGFLYFYFYSTETPTARGNQSQEIYFVIWLYLFMLLGILAHPVYHHFSQPKRQRRKFDLGLMFAPIFASPIIFLPLLSAMQNADIDLALLTKAKCMVFLVAFQNGFFWKEYFDNRRPLKESESNAK